MSTPFVFQRTTEVQGVAPHKLKPIKAEYGYLKDIKPTELTKSAQLYLSKRFGVTKSSDLAVNAVYLVLGNPRYEDQLGKRFVVSDVLNQEIPGWGAVTDGKDANLKPFGPQESALGLYTGSQVYVHDNEGGQGFFDNLSAATLSPTGILFNAHADNYSNSVFHEVFHTFQGSKLTNHDVFKEGIVELISVMFANEIYGVKLDYYPGYAKYVPDAQKLIAYTDERTVARAFFQDDDDAIEALTPLFYKPIADTLPSTQKISPEGLLAAKSLPIFSGSGNLAQFLMKKDGSWYRRWVERNGGAVPAGGLALPAKQAPRLGPGLRAPAKVEPPPLISPPFTPPLAQGSGVPPLVKNLDTK